MNSRELDGKAAIVTGSARNLGRAIAIGLAEAGAAVVINARHSDVAARAVAAEIEAAGGAALVHLADVTDEDAVTHMVETAVATFGRLDILVSNVSHRIARPVTEITLDAWHDVVGSTLDGAFLCARAAIPHLEKSGAGAIVTIGGVSGHAAVANRTAVAAAKAGLAGFTGSLGAELASKGVTVNCVAPGHLERASAPGEMSEHFRIRPIPVGRGGTAEEAAAMVRFLCGPQARYITGQVIHVNGGWHSTIA